MDGWGGCFAIVAICVIILVIVVEYPILGGIILIVIGIGFFYLIVVDKKQHKQYIASIKHIETYKIEDIINICNITKEEMGTSGYFSMIVAVEGFAKGNIPQVYVTNSGLGGTYKNVRVKDDKFYIEDGTGTILVKVDQLNAFYDNKGEMLTKKNDPYPSCLKVKKTKDIDGPIYVIGNATDRSGELVIQKPQIEHFLVALTSKKIYLQQHGSSSMLIGCGIFLIFIGLMLLAGVKGFVK